MNHGNWKELIATALHEQAECALKSKNYFKLLTYTDSTQSVPLLKSILDFLDTPAAFGEFESLLIHALTSSRDNNLKYINDIRYLLDIADYEALRLAGDKFPIKNTYRLYRGVSGVECDAIDKGYHWTDSLPIARKFASRRPDLFKPRVLITVISNENVLFHSNDRSESEFFLDIDNSLSNQNINVEIFELL